MCGAPSERLPNIAACLPVFTLVDEYLQFDFEKKSAGEGDEFHGLLEEKEGCLDFDLTLSHLRDAWLSRNIKKILICMKLFTAFPSHAKQTWRKRKSSRHDATTRVSKGTCIFYEKIIPDKGKRAP